MSIEQTSAATIAPPLPGLRLGKIEDLPETVMSELEMREDIQAEFANDPKNPQLWAYVEGKVIEEQATGVGQPEELRDITAEELVDFARVIYNTPPADRYQLMTQKAPNHKLWFDVLYGFHSPSGSQALDTTLNFRLREQKRDKFENILDIGCGTGKIVDAVSKHAEHTFGIDVQPELLTVAKENHPEANIVEASAAELPFEDASMDVITSSGLVGALDARTAEAMFREVARVLKPGGMYMDTQWVPARRIILSVGGAGDVEHPDYHPEELASFVTWRALLQDMIVDTTSGKFEKADHLSQSGHAWDQFILSLGLYQMKMRSNNGWSELRVLVKDSQKAQAEARMWSAHMQRMQG